MSINSRSMNIMCIHIVFVLSSSSREKGHNVSFIFTYIIFLLKECHKVMKVNPCVFYLFMNKDNLALCPHFLEKVAKSLEHNFLRVSIPFEIFAEDILIP